MDDWGCLWRLEGGSCLLAIDWIKLSVVLADDSDG